ncbi:MAG: N-6 DNA methylase [FCB group bacterium]|nr:N-6 DNA methylase [FCB group bacterium]
MMANKKQKTEVDIKLAKLIEDLLENYLSDPQKNIPVVETLINDFPDAWLLHSMLAEMKSQESETLPEAIKEYSTCIELQPDEAGHYYSRAICYEKNDNLEKALSDIRTAQDKAIDESYFSELVRLELKAGNYENALHLYDNGEWNDLNSATEEWTSLAQYYRENEQFDQALSILENIRFLEGGAAADIWDPQPEIDAITASIHKQELDKYRNIKFQHESSLGDLFLQTVSKVESVYRREDIVNVAKVIFFKRLIDIDLSTGKDSPYRNFEVPAELNWQSTDKTESKDKKPISASILAEFGKSPTETLSVICSRQTSLDEKHLVEVISFLDRYIFSISNISVYIFGKAFNSFIANADHRLYRDKPSGWKSPSTHASPIILQRIMVDILNINEGDRIFDPASGYGRLLIADQTNDSGLIGSLRTRAVGYEINAEVNLMAKMNLIMNGINDFDLQAIDAFDSKNEDPDCDVAVCHPPFGKSTRVFYKKFKLWDTAYSRYDELRFMQLMLTRLKWEGRFAIVLPLGLLSQTGQAKNFRKSLLQMDYVDRVVGLPGRTLGETSMRTALVFGTKRSHPRKNQSIMFSSQYNPDYALWEGMKIGPDPDREIFRESSISYSDLAKLGYPLNPLAFDQEDAEMSIDAYTSMSATKTRVKSVIVSALKGKVLNKKIKNQLATYPIIKISNLKDDIFDNKLDEMDIQTLPELKEIDSHFDSLIITEDCVLIALAGKKLKPTIFEFTGTPILTSSNVLALIPNKAKISCEYLVKELNSERAQGQVQLIRGGSTVSNIRLADFLRIGIDVPTLPEQKARLEEYQNFLINQKLVSDTTFRVALEKARKEFNDGLGVIRHNLGQVVGAVSLNNDSLQHYIRETHPEILSESIVPNSGDETAPHAHTVDGVLQRISASFKKMEYEMRTIQLITKGLKEGLKPEVVTIKQLFNEKILEHESENVNIQIGNLREEQIKGFTFDAQILADKAMLGSALEQILLNAIKHGKREDKVLNIWLDFTKYLILEEEIYHEISIRNDGHPLPPQFSLELYSEIGGNTGVTGNSGIGGYVIAKIAEMHDGKLRAQNLPTGQVEISILLLTGITLDEINWTD